MSILIMNDDSREDCRQFTTNIWEIIYVIVVQKFARGSWVDMYDIFATWNKWKLRNFRGGPRYPRYIIPYIWYIFWHPKRCLVAAQQRRCIYPAARKPVKVGNCHPRCHHLLRTVISLFLLSFSTEDKREIKRETYTASRCQPTSAPEGGKTINCPDAGDKKRKALHGVASEEKESELGA